MNTSLEKIKNDLLALGIKAGDVLMVHSSLKSMGQVEGGAETVIAALRAVLGEEGTLMLPALSYATSCESSFFSNLETPSCVGHITEVFRKQEGAALETKFLDKIDNITSLLASIEPYEKERVEKIRSRIKDTLEKQVGVDYDKNRFEQELIFYIEKLDINEEKQRLTNHLNYFVETIKGPAGQGKKMGFIAQEMGREINTLGSKSNHAEMQNIVVKMKDELEQIKEQVLNVL